MKIKEKYSLILEWTIAIALILLTLNFSFFSYGNSSPLKAHQQSEETYHYGPSEIIRTIDLKDTKIYLARYKDWFSANTVRKGIIKWYPGSGVGGSPIDYTRQVTYSWSGSKYKNNSSLMITYGYANDPNITTMLAEEEDGTYTTYELDDSRLFVFYRIEEKINFKIKKLKGLNSAGEVIYEENIHN